MLRIGKAKPLSMKAGVKKKNEPMTACCWVCEMVETKRPTPRVVIRYRAAAKNSRNRLPRSGMWKTTSAAAVMKATWISATRAKGRVFPIISSMFLMGDTTSCSYVPFSRSLTSVLAV